MIVIDNLSKRYPLGHGHKKVISNLNLTINRGQHIAFLGRNGAGKTTLIKLIGGVEMPTSGKIHRKMSISWPLGFSGAFQGSLTGYDNARFIARVYGADYAAIRDFVEDFTELGRQLKAPVKTYSAGMRARLAFALSLAIEFDCYMIDEIILVGDSNFHAKCQHELFEKRSDRALIIASHDMSLIQQHCDCALMLQNGTGILHDRVEDAVAAYNAA